MYENNKLERVTIIDCKSDCNYLSVNKLNVNYFGM